MNALQILVRHLKTMVDGGYLPIEDVARLLGCSTQSTQDLLDGKLVPSRELVAEIEALSESFKNDPAGEWARKLAGQRRVNATGAVKVFEITAASRKRR